MSALDIHPHSRGLSKLAVVGISLLAAGSFAMGISRAIQRPDASPFPVAEPVTAQKTVSAGAIPEATPAPDRQLAAIAHPRHPAAAPSVLAEIPGAPAVEALTAADASATAPDAPPPAAPSPAPSPADPPT